MKPIHWLIFSLLCNAILAAAIVTVARKPPVSPTSAALIESVAHRMTRVRQKTIEEQPAVVEVTPAFHWRDIESEDYQTYVANLRSIGCPEATIRDIIVADVHDLFSRRVIELALPFHNQFWNLLADYKQLEKLVEEKHDEVQAIEKERDNLLAELFGNKNPHAEEDEREAKERAQTGRKQQLSFLPEDKLAECLALDEKFNRLRNELSEDGKKLPPAERQEQLKALAQDRQRALQKLLSPEEHQEYDLRTSKFANLRDQLRGFEGTEEEFRVMAQARMTWEKDLPDFNRKNPDYETKKQQADQARLQADEQIKGLLGEERFAAYQRAQDPKYHEVLRVAERYQLPSEKAVEVLEMRQAVEKQVSQLRADQTLAPEQKAQMLEAMRIETEGSMAGALGAEALQVYKRNFGGWINGLSETSP